jgi:hypothetical protein
MMEKGYRQALENMVYETIKLLQSDFDRILDHGEMTDAYWEKLDDIMLVCAETYNKSLDDVANDYENMLESTLIEIIEGSYC